MTSYCFDLLAMYVHVCMYYSAKCFSLRSYMCIQHIHTYFCFIFAVHLKGDDSQQGAVPVDKEVTHNDEDSGSVGTIYESIDNLVSQFDVALRQIGENMRAGSPQSLTKKKEQSLLRQHSFLSSRSKSKTKLLTEKKAELEKGERYSGYLWKKTNTGSWKKRWCVLKGCMFCYYK